MTITKKPNGKYKVRVYVGYDHLTGKQSYKSATVATMKEAKLKEAQLSVKVGTGELVPTWEQDKPREHYTFDMAYEEWFEVYRQQDLKQATIDRVEYYFNHYLLKPDLFGGLYFERMTVLDIQKRVNKFIPTLVASKSILSYAKQIFKYAMASEHIQCDKNYLDLVRMVKPKKAMKREYRYYTETQAVRFEQGINEYFKDDYKYLVVFTLLLRTGIRVGELTGLRWENIDFGHSIALLNGRMSRLISGTYQYEDGLKNGDDSRVIELDRVTLNVLRRFKLQQQEISMLLGAGFNESNYIVDVKRTAIDDMRKKFLKWYNLNHDEKLPMLNLHGLRHTHASLLISNGVEMKQVSDRLGHRNILTTANIYADVTPKARREVAEMFSKIMESH